MDNLSYSKELNTFSFQFNKSEIGYISENSKIRIVISKLYYALLHYYFMKYPYIASSSGGQKHESILRILSKERSTEYRLFQKLKGLREWADYAPLNNPPFRINIINLLHQVNKQINSK